MEHPEPIKKLLRYLQQVPYLASKNLYRVATHFLEMEPEQRAAFCETVLQLDQAIRRCTACFAWQEKDGTCVLCNDGKRNKQLICVVERWQDVIAIERAGGYNGTYHILGGAISPLLGIGAMQLTIDALVQRASGEAITEIILALGQTPEGDATAAYIAHKLEKSAVQISCLAQGLPVGSTLEYLDRVTLSKAIVDRKRY